MVRLIDANRIDSGIYARELNRALALGAVRAWSEQEGSGIRPRRRWEITLANGERAVWEAGRVQAFLAGVLSVHDA